MGATTLISAYSKGHLEIVKLLIAAGANMDIQDKVNSKSAVGCLGLV
jgi:ankyrin repeat protein